MGAFPETLGTRVLLRTCSHVCALQPHVHDLWSMSASSQNSSAVPAAPPLSTLPLLHPSLSRLLEKSFPVAIQKVLPSVLQSAQLLSPEDFARILTGADLLKKLVSEQLEVELKKIVPEWILPVYVASFDAQWAAFPRAH